MVVYGQKRSEQEGSAGQEGGVEVVRPKRVSDTVFRFDSMLENFEAWEEGGEQEAASHKLAW